MMKEQKEFQLQIIFVYTVFTGSFLAFILVTSFIVHS